MHSTVLPLLSQSLSPPSLPLSASTGSTQTHSLSNNPSIFVLEWRSNAFHLCVSVCRAPRAWPATLYSLPLSTSTPFQQNPESGSTQPLKSKISLHAGAPPGLRQQEEVGQTPGSQRFSVTMKYTKYVNEIINHIPKASQST